MERSRQKKRSFDLSEQLAQTVLNLDRTLSEKKIEVEAELEEELCIYSDPGLLQIVWNNILSNSIKFTPPGGTVCIGASPWEDECVVAIRDSGCGIPEEKLERIFDKFYQVDSSHSTKGNGLGLTMVKEILELLKGRIEVRSTPGEGCEFRVILPRGTLDQMRDEKESLDAGQIEAFKKDTRRRKERDHKVHK